MRTLMWDGGAVTLEAQHDSGGDTALPRDNKQRNQLQLHSRVVDSPVESPSWPTGCVACRNVHMLGDGYECFQTHDDVRRGSRGRRL